MIPRPALLGILQSMEIYISPDTKMTDEDLEQRLGRAWDAAQNLKPKTEPLTKLEAGGKLEPWKDLTTLQHQISRTSISDNAAYYNSSMPGEMVVVDGGATTAFRSIRGILWAMAGAFASGKKGILLHNEDNKTCMLLLISKVLAVDQSTPMIVVDYERITRKDARTPWIFKNPAPDPTTLGGGILLSDQQLALLKLLTQNADRLPKSEKRQKANKTQRKKSLLLPLGVIDSATLGRLNMDRSCAVCSKPTYQKCKDCLLVAYCSDECQREHWKKSHKLACKSLKDAKWTPFKFTPPTMPGTEGYYYTTINVRDDLGRGGRSDRPPKRITGEVLENPHNDQPFLIKIQDNSSTNLLVTDRKKDLEAWMPRPRQWAPSSVWEELRTAIEDKGFVADEHRAKCYFWARRTGDWELSLALDRVPDQESLVW